MITVRLRLPPTSLNLTAPPISFLIDKPPSSDGFVSCPLCSRRVKLETINVHIDNGCRLNPLVPNGNEDGKEKKSSVDVKGQWSKIMGGGGSAKTKAKGKAGETYVPS